MTEDTHGNDSRLWRQKNRPWDDLDRIAMAILALIRAQNMVESVRRARCHAEVADAKYEKAYVAREKAMQRLVVARDAFNRERELERSKNELNLKDQACARRRSIRLATKDGKDVP